MSCCERLFALKFRRRRQNSLWIESSIHWLKKSISGSENRTIVAGRMELAGHRARLQSRGCEDRDSRIDRICLTRANYTRQCIEPSRAAYASPGLSGILSRVRYTPSHVRRLAWTFNRPVCSRSKPSYIAYVTLGSEISSRLCCIQLRIVRQLATSQSRDRQSK